MLDVGGFTTVFRTSTKYAAPELLDLPAEDEGVDNNGQEEGSTPTTKATDVWAFGMVGAEASLPHSLLCLIVGGLEVFARIRELNVPPFVIKGGRPKQTDFLHISKEADAVWPLLEMCWNHDPGLRPTMEDVVRSLS